MSNKTQHQKRKLLLWLLIIVLIIVPSLLDLRQVLSIHFPYQDKYFHVAIFALFLVLTYFFFPKLSLLKNSIFSFALGLLIELLQGLFTHGQRQFDITDVYFNGLGIVLGLTIVWVYRRWVA